MRKLKMDVDHMHRIRRKIQARQVAELDIEDQRWILDLIRRAEGVFYPGRRAWDRYQCSLLQISRTDPKVQPTEFDNLAERVREFEEKYC